MVMTVGIMTVLLLMMMIMMFCINSSRMIIIDIMAATGYMLAVTVFLAMVVKLSSAVFGSFSSAIKEALVLCRLL